MRKTLLIIEDDATIRSSLTDILEIEFPKLRVLTAGDGKEGLQILRGTKIDFYLLDLSLGGTDGVDGVMVMEAARQDPRLKYIPFYVMSGRTQMEVASIAPGAKFLKKPFDFDVLFNILKTELKL